MAEPVRLGLDEAEALAYEALVASRTSPANARATARALVAAEADGQAGHGLSRVPSYALQARAGKVDGHATPRLEQVAGAALRVDGGFGFAYPAIDLAIAALAPLARAQGIAVAALHRSHHFGQAGAHAERLAERGLVAIVLGNSPKAMAFWGGRKADARHQSARLRRAPAGRRRPARDRPRDVGGGPRQDRRRREGRQADPGRLGRGRRGPPDHRPEGRARRHAAADRRRQGRRAGADDRDPRRSGHGQRVRLGGELVLRRPRAARRTWATS